MTTKLLQKQISPNGEEFVRCIKRQGTPSRVHTIELSIDGEIEEAVCKRYDVLKGLDPSDEYYAFKRKIAIQRFLGYDYVIVDIENNRFPLTKMIVEDSSGNLKREGGRSYIDEHKGPVMSMDDFKQYPWPNPSTYMTKALEWYNKNLPDDMVIIGGLTGHFFEHLSWLMGYETLCLALCEEPELIRAISDRELELDRAAISLMLQFDRVKVIWGSDDMGFKGGLMISPDQMREYVLAGHKNLAAMTHAAGRSYILHSCGKLNDIYEDLITDVGIDGKHSYEDTIESICDVKKQFNGRLSVLGGIDVDFLCRATPDEIRKRVRDTVSCCQSGGGFCLGTGNSVANYIPVENYLVMLDEGRNCS